MVRFAGYPYMNIINNLIKIDVAILIAIIGLGITLWQNIQESRKERINREKQKNQEMKESLKRETRMEERINFIESRLNNVEMWISANSGFRG